jgi:hypothetical protein
MVPTPEPAYTDDQGVPRDADGEPIHGYTEDGTPKKKAGRPRGRRVTSSRSRTTAGAAPRPVAAPQPKKTAGTTGTRASSKKPDYTEGIAKIFGMIGGALVLAPEPFSLDGMAVLQHGQNLAEGVNELAGEIPAVAAVCEKLLRAAPTFKIVSALASFGAQLLVNHRIIPEHLGSQAGALPVDHLRGARDVMLGRIVQDAPEHEGQQQDVFAEQAETRG